MPGSAWHQVSGLAPPVLTTVSRPDRFRLVAGTGAGDGSGPAPLADLVAIGDADISPPAGPGGGRIPATGSMQVLHPGRRLVGPEVQGAEFHHRPLPGNLRSSAEDRIAGLSECASAFASTLRRACDPGGCASDVLPDEFLRATAPAFGAAVGAIEAGRDLDAEAAWVDASLQAALALAGEVASPLSGRADPQWISRAFASIGRRKLGLQSPDNEDRQ